MPRDRDRGNTAGIGDAWLFIIDSEEEDKEHMNESLALRGMSRFWESSNGSRYAYWSPRDVIPLKRRE